MPPPDQPGTGFSVHQEMGRVPWETPGARRMLVGASQALVLGKLSSPAALGLLPPPTGVSTADGGGRDQSRALHPPPHPQHLTDPQASTKGPLVFVGTLRGLGSGTLNWLQEEHLPVH